MKNKKTVLIIIFLGILIGAWQFKMVNKVTTDDNSTPQILSLEEKFKLVQDISEDNGKTTLKNFAPEKNGPQKITKNLNRDVVDSKKFSYSNKLDDPRSLEAKEKEENWASNRLEYFKNELLLSEEQIIELKNLWEETQKTERNLFAEELLSEDSDALDKNMEKIKANRLESQKQIKKIIGEESLTQYLVYYQSHWNIREGSSLNKIHLPLQ